MPAYYLLTVGKQVGVYGGPYGGSEYSLVNACSVCGTGAECVGPHILPGIRRAWKGVLVTLDLEILIPDELAGALKTIGEDFLRDVVRPKSGERIPYYELMPQGILPRFSAQTKGYEIEAQCPACKRDGHFNIPHVPLQLVYEDVDPSLAKKDVLCTFEHFGNSKLRTPFKDSGFASPLFVVSERFATCLKENGARRVELEEVKGLG